jgi:hypothetical protein
MANRIPVLISLMIMIIITTGCGQTPAVSKSTLVPPIEDETLPTPAATLPELVRNMSDDNMAVRLVSIYELDIYGKDAVIAVPVLIDNLNVDDQEVRVAAIDALGHLGANAKAAIPGLIKVLHNDSYIHAKDAAATALGYIGDHEIVPDLAVALFAENPYHSYDVAISCAKSIARITGEKFTDYDAIAYTIDKNGTPLIVIDAREWWEQKGQYQDWSVH